MNKNTIANIFRLQAYGSVMCGYFYIGFIDFILKGNNLTGFTNLFYQMISKKVLRIDINEIINNDLKFQV